MWVMRWDISIDFLAKENKMDLCRHLTSDDKLVKVVERGIKDDKHKDNDKEEGKGGFIEKVKNFIHDVGEKIEEAIGFRKPTAGLCCEDSMVVRIPKKFEEEDDRNIND
ncbi:hypothetical protein RIF29_11747 [Crotalaria pallida]|uniref:Uncharacterized protein n=1 Tax=Crotalaria pallida TaxID=3830 RepID=A0AAN9IMF0_CROPI